MKLDLCRWWRHDVRLICEVTSAEHLWMGFRCWRCHVMGPHYDFGPIAPQALTQVRPHLERFTAVGIRSDEYGTLRRTRHLIEYIAGKVCGWDVNRLQPNDDEAWLAWVRVMS